MVTLYGHHAGSPSDCGRVECYTTAACSAAHIQYEEGVRGCCCGIWWFYPLLMLYMSRMKSNVVKPCVFNLILLIKTGDRYFEVSLINVILALFSDDPQPITNPIIQCTKMSVIILA